jgi:molybdopterin-containing oxidoreductase family membrane subunit
MERIWKVYLQPNFTSLLAQLVWGYTLFTLAILVALWLTARQPGALVTRVVMALGLFLAVFLSGGVGALLGVNASRGAWHVGMLPAQFPIFSLTSGVALLMIVVGWLKADDGQRAQQLRLLSLAMVVLLVIKAYYLWTDFSLALYAGTPDTAEAVNLVLYGRWSWAFWGLQLGLGMIVPLLVLIQRPLAQNGLWAGFMGVAILIGFAVARANIIFPALAIPELDGLVTAFTGPHLQIDYVPSLMELSVVAGVVGLATVAYLLGMDRLPLFTRATAEMTK